MRGRPWGTAPIPVISIMNGFKTGSPISCFFGRRRNRTSLIIPWEVEPDGTIRQKRTVGDRQNKDLEDAVVFLRKWQEEIQKRLTLEDYRLAKESSRLRVEEFKKLREEKAKIWHGHLQGQLLADVLERDLMEAVRSAEVGDRNLGLPGDGLVSGNLSDRSEECIKQEEQETEQKEKLVLAVAA